jgi:hypothetical protein
LSSVQISLLQRLLHNEIVWFELDKRWHAWYRVLTNNQIRKKNNATRLDFFFDKLDKHGVTFYKISCLFFNVLTLPWQAWTKISLGFPAKLVHLSAVS